MTTRRRRGLRAVILLELCATALLLLALLSAGPLPLLLLLLGVSLSAGLLAFALAAGIARRREDQAAQVREELVKAAHQLRTPTATLMLEADALLAHGNLPAPAHEGLARIAAQADLLHQRTDRLLRHARLSAQRSHHEPMSVAALLEDASRLLAPEAQRRGVAVEVRAALPTITGDPAELRELLLILGENALEHGTGPVRISIAPDGRRARIDVYDGGAGVSEEDAAAAALAGRLGLDLAQRILARHGGHLVLRERPAPGCPAVSAVLPMNRADRKSAARNGGYGPRHDHAIRSSPARR